ncbi:MAG: response regulator transcription factor [Actinomycetota bacterium]|nr:response regulator transcription factor [Actinomycetota bacterium]
METKAIIVSAYPLVIEGLKAVLGISGEVSVISSATSCAEAIPKIKSLSPDVVIASFQLPDGSVCEIVKVCKLDNPSIKYIVISSADQGKYFEEALKEGVHAFLLNSVTQDELIVAIKTALADEIYIHPKLASAVFGVKRMANDGSIYLTPRQKQTIELMAGGYSNKEIASHLNLSVETVNTHVKQILRKLQAKDRAQAVAIAFRNSLII